MQPYILLVNIMRIMWKNVIVCKFTRKLDKILVMCKEDQKMLNVEKRKRWDVACR